jgi:isopenicillin N synthase-like dioxygenase
MSRLVVPTVDISAWAGGDGSTRQGIADAVDEAATSVGFMQITGHGIPSQAVAGLTSAMDGFFSRPAQEKRSLLPPSSAVNRGYTAPRSERLSHSLGVYSPDDLFEAFNVGTEADQFPGLDLDRDAYSANIWPDRPEGFRPWIEAWFRLVQDLAVTMTDIFALALDLPGDYFRSFTDHSIDVLRVNNYQLPDGDVRLAPGQLGMGPHTDFGIVTVLWADPLPGLQILDEGGGWNDVVPAPGALLINLGDLLARWTGDRWLSTMHRVKAPIDGEGRVFRRRSAALFHDGNADAVITSLSGSRAGGRSYEPITVADHVAAKLAGSRGLQLNERAHREAARLSVGPEAG